MDVQVPEGDGFATTRIIRETEGSSRKHLLIIALTAHSMKGDAERCLPAGMGGYISRPLQTTETLRYGRAFNLLPKRNTESPADMFQKEFFGGFERDLKTAPDTTGIRAPSLVLRRILEPVPARFFCFCPADLGSL